MKLLVINESNGNNLGDKFIHLGIVSLFSDFCELEHLQLSYESLPFSNKGGDKKKASVKKNIIKFFPKSPVLLGIFSIIRVFIYNLKRFRVLIEKISNADFVLFGGGSLLIDNNFNFPLNLFFLSLICKTFNKSYGVAGVSTRNMNNRLSIILLKRFLLSAKFIYVRDCLSLRLCSTQFSIRAKYLPDFAFYIPHSKNSGSKRNVESEKNSLAINVMGRQSHGYFSVDSNIEHYIAFIVNLVVEAKERNYAVTIFSTGEPADEEFISLISSKIYHIARDKIQVIQPLNFGELIEVYNNNKFIIATRLHSAIIGLSLGNSVVCYNWDQKVEGLFSSFSLENSLLSPYDNLDTCLAKTGKLSVSTIGLFYKFRSDFFRNV